MAAGSVPPAMAPVPTQVVLLAMVPALLWGFSPVLSKRGMAGGGTAVQAALVVVLVDSAVYWAALVARHGLNPFPALGPAVVATFAAAGVVGTALGRLAVFEGVHRVGASINSAGISTRPLFATLLALVWLGEPVGLETAVGVVVLVAGLVVLALARGGDVTGWSRTDLVYPLAAAAFFGLGNVVRRFALTTSTASPLQGVAINETAALAVLGGYAIATRGRSFAGAPRRTYLYFTGSGLITAVALLSLFAAFGLQAGRVALVDPLTATAPLFTAVFAYFLLEDLERVTLGVVGGAALVVVGAVLVTV